LQNPHFLHLTGGHSDVILGWEAGKPSPAGAGLSLVESGSRLFFYADDFRLSRVKAKKPTPILKKCSAFWIFRLTANRQQFRIHNAQAGDTALRGRNRSAAWVPFGRNFQKKLFFR
jgi:hypothetical protein